VERRVVLSHQQAGLAGAGDVLRRERQRGRIAGEQIEAEGSGGELADRGLTLTELADLTLANLSILKNGRARAIRFSTLTALCHALDCQPGDLLTVRPTNGSR
jgi:putative transcriptional regulator